MLRFGLQEKTPCTLGEAGAQLGCTYERVRQIQNEALHKLRWLIERDDLSVAMFF